MKQFKKISKFWISIVLVCIVCISVWTTYSAYTSRSYVKGVSSTPKQSLNLSSNYLGVVSINTIGNEYPVKKIILSEKDDEDETPYEFSFTITNSADGSLNTKRMQYYLTISNMENSNVVITSNGLNLTEDVKTTTGYKAPIMPAYQKVTHTYNVSIPKEDIHTIEDMVVCAKPDSDSDTSGFVLGARLQPSITGVVATFSFEGKLIENINRVNEHAAFNYQITISKTSETHTMVLSWNKDLLEIDPLFLTSIGQNTNNTGEVVIPMNEDNNSYLIQFYRLKGRSDVNFTWENMNIQFKEQE